LAILSADEPQAGSAIRLPIHHRGEGFGIGLGLLFSPDVICGDSTQHEAEESEGNGLGEEAGDALGFELKG
jgi:hypothetical protein